MTLNQSLETDEPDGPIYRSIRETIAQRRDLPPREVLAFHAGRLEDYVLIQDAVSGTEVALTVTEVNEIAKAARRSVQASAF